LFVQTTKLTVKEIEQIEKDDIVFACEPCRKKKVTNIKRSDSVSETELKKMSLDEMIETRNELKENVKKFTSIVEDFNLTIKNFEI
jgi:hypothetical protein